ncbi:hypothetical protein ACFL0P_07550 [Candidatus Omnitrophota bacterium]
MRGILVIMLTFCFLVQPYHNVVLAESVVVDVTETNDSIDEHEMEYGRGVVKEVHNDDDIIVVTETNDADFHTDVIYKISSDTKFSVSTRKNLLNKLISRRTMASDLSIGDTVKIEYFVLASGTKEAQAISVE